MRAARALAAFEGRRAVNENDVRRVSAMSLRHRLRRDALDETATSEQIEQAVDEVFPRPTTSDSDRRQDKDHTDQENDGDGPEPDLKQPQSPARSRNGGRLLKRFRDVRASALTRRGLKLVSISL